MAREYNVKKLKKLLDKLPKSMETICLTCGHSPDTFIHKSTNFKGAESGFCCCDNDN
jgi:hypothetical protein